jgi:Fe-S-cluster containining protein
MNALTQEERTELLETLERLHGEVDREARALVDALNAELRCGVGCRDCCVDDIRVFEIETELIRRRHGALLEQADAHPPGACAFLDTSGACRIYPNRPYVCRTQGLPLRWMDETDSGELADFRDICPLNESAAGLAPVERLPMELCWTIGPREGELHDLQARFASGQPPRVSLRSLFHKSSLSSGASGPTQD